MRDHLTRQKVNGFSVGSIDTDKEILDSSVDERLIMSDGIVRRGKHRTRPDVWIGYAGRCPLALNRPTRRHKGDQRRVMSPQNGIWWPTSLCAAIGEHGIFSLHVLGLKSSPRPLVSAKIGHVGVGRDLAEGRAFSPTTDEERYPRSLHWPRPEGDVIQPEVATLVAEGFT